MNFPAVRWLMFQVHMWVGLVLGVLLGLLGLSGSILVYDDAIVEMLAPVPQAAAKGEALSLDKIVEAARGAAGRGAMQIALAREPGEAVSVRVTQPRAGEGVRGDGHGERRTPERQQVGRQAGAQGGPPGQQPATQVFIDPVSGAVLGTRKAQLPPILAFAHQLHGNFFMGREGRQFVGWMGVAMLILGCTGLVLWWPKRGQWKYAFFVRRTAKGLRFHRELHAATGIWIFVVFMIVSFSGVAIAFPNTMTMLSGRTAATPTYNLREGPSIEPLEGATAIGAAEALAIAQKTLPDATPTSITIPVRRDRTIVVNMLASGAVGAGVYIDPWRGQVVATRDPSQIFLAWQRPLHQGLGLGAIWKLLVFFSGLVPALFVFTGIAMWLQKRKRHLPMSAVLAEEAVG
ncbi:MAG: PepSY-associated TM helix domain-containing protein [Rhizomicrobium sp.]